MHGKPRITIEFLPLLPEVCLRKAKLPGTRTDPPTAPDRLWSVVRVSDVVGVSDNEGPRPALRLG